LKTDTGIGIGSTVAAVSAGYGEKVSIAQGEGGGSAITITTPNGTLSGETEGVNDGSKLTHLRAGVSCTV
jgi:hypothetical protein